MYNARMEQNLITEYFEEVETTKEYDGYFCSVAQVMTLVLLAGCALGESAPEFRRMGDAALLPYLENSLYEQLVSDLDSSDYFVENVQAVYISLEYLDELAFNSQENVYFGYTLSELNAQF